MSTSLSRPAQALLLDVGGTLMTPQEPVGVTYARVAGVYGGARCPDEIEVAFRAAWRAWEGPRQIGDGRPFWRRMVSLSTGCEDPRCFEALYAHYARPEAWSLRSGALAALRRIRAAGIRVAIASNWDTRLRSTLGALGIPFDAAAISGELGVEKPSPALFLAACEALGVAPASAVHLGDSPREDVDGARGAGCQALLWGVDLRRFSDLPPLLEGLR